MTNERALAKISIPQDPDDREYDSKHMSRLTARNRKFVIKMLEQGVNPKAAPRAAVECGYDARHGWRLMRDPDIIGALREEATKRLAGAALLGINVMIEIASTPDHKDQFKAAKELSAINGYTAEQRIVVEHIGDDSKAMLVQVKKMAAEMNMDVAELIKSAGIIEGEFTEVKPIEVDDSDW